MEALREVSINWGYPARFSCLWNPMSVRFKRPVVCMELFAGSRLILGEDTVEILFCYA